MQCVAVFCSVLQCVAVCCSVLQYARVAVCCSVLHCEVSSDFSGWHSYRIDGGALGVSQEKRRFFGISSHHQSSRTESYFVEKGPDKEK